MGFPFAHPEDVTPRANPPTSDPEISDPAKPATCLQCGQHPAIVLSCGDCSRIGAVFCSMLCAADFGCHQFTQLDYVRCTMCGNWTDFDATCADCDIIVDLYDDPYYSEMDTPIIGEKGVEYDA